MSEALTTCTKCTHYQPKEAPKFYCKLHDQEYSVNQDNCEDLEDKEDYESTTYECD